MIANYVRAFGNFCFCFSEDDDKVKIIVEEDRAGEYILNSGADFLLTSSSRFTPLGIRTLDSGILNWLTGFRTDLGSIELPDVTTEYLRAYIERQKSIVRQWPKFLRAAINATLAFRVIGDKFESGIPGRARITEEYEFHRKLGLKSDVEFYPELLVNTYPRMLNAFAEIRFREMSVEDVRRWKPFGENCNIIRFGEVRGKAEPGRLVLFPGRAMDTNDPRRAIRAAEILKFFYYEDFRCWCKIKGEAAFVVSPGAGPLTQEYAVDITVEDV